MRITLTNIENKNGNKDFRPKEYMGNNSYIYIFF